MLSPFAFLAQRDRAVGDRADADRTTARMDATIKVEAQNRQQNSGIQIEFHPEKLQTAFITLVVLEMLL